MKRLLVALSLVMTLAIPAYGPAFASSHTTHSSKSSDKKIHVHGYYRKDGTYVAPYERSAPGSGKATPSASSHESTSAPTSSQACKTCPRDENGKIKRSAAARDAFMRQTGYPHGRPGYVVDHIKPLECGGADDPSNMQWQTAAEAKAKDKTEGACRK